MVTENESGQNGQATERSLDNRETILDMEERSDYMQKVVVNSKKDKDELEARAKAFISGVVSLLRKQS